MAKQTEMEVLLSKFRSNINKGDIYVLEEKNGKVIQLRKVRYFAGGEFEELNKVANENKAEYDKLIHDEKLAQQEYLANNFNGLQTKLDNEKAKNHRLSELLLKALKVLYGTSEEDFAILLSQIESEVNGNE